MHRLVHWVLALTFSLLALGLLALEVDPVARSSSVEQRQRTLGRREHQSQQQLLEQLRQRQRQDDELLRAADVINRPAGSAEEEGELPLLPGGAPAGGSAQDSDQIGSAYKYFHSFADLVIPYGYPLEEHFVQTSDGYILRMFRIPHGRFLGPGPGPASPTLGPAVLLQHGLLDSAAEFLLLGPGKALGLLLADAGFDVWLPNSRGNALSRNHSHLDLSSLDYWAFSFDEMAQYDLPAELDYVLRATGQAQLSYVGFSQGSTIALAALSTQPQLARRINVAVLMAPVAFVAHIRSLPLLALAAMGTDMMFQLLGVREFLPSQHLVQLLEGELCFLEPSLCLNLLAAINGFDGRNINATKLPLYLQYTPAGASVQDMAHWAQCVRQALPHTLSHFDWGNDCSSSSRRSWGHCNLIKYGQLSPPHYPLGHISTPLMLLTGGQDRLADPLDMELLREVLPQGVVRKEVHVEQYEHLDFVWAENADQLLYRPVLDFLSAASTADS